MPKPQLIAIAHATFLFIVVGFTAMTTVRAQTCGAPPLFDLGGPNCSAVGQGVECGCSECLAWDPAAGATWYEIRRCDPSGANCTLVGDTRWRPRPDATLWCVAWDDPFPRYRRSFDYTVRACKVGAAGPVCSASFSNPVGYLTAPYMCIDHGLEVACAVSDSPGQTLLADLDGDGLTDAVDPDDDDDGFPDGQDNCPQTRNIGQRDADQDGVGDACDPEPLIPGEGPADADFDGIGDSVDDCPGVSDPFQEDSDADRTGDACDNCPLLANETQTDTDDDGEGDRCDLDDGAIFTVWATRSRLIWAPEAGYTSWYVYRGDLAELRRSGSYTQAPGSNPSAARFCNLPTLWVYDAVNPPVGGTAFYLAAGRPGPYSTELGTDSAGVIRLNTRPCP